MHQAFARVLTAADPELSTSQDAEGRRTCTYNKKVMLALSFSPLVHVPEGMAPFDEWYGYV